MKDNRSRSVQGATTSIVLLTIMGSISLFIGAITLLASFAVFFEEYSSGFGLFALFFMLLIAACLITGGLVMIIYPRKLEALRASSAAKLPSSDVTSPAQPNVPEPAPAPNPIVQGNAAAQQNAPVTVYSEEAARLINRSENIFATCKDLVLMGDSRPDLAHLTSMLAASGVMSWDDAPICDSTRLTRTSHFWLRGDPSELSDENYDRYITVEAAINAHIEMDSVESLDCDDARTQEAAQRYLHDFALQQITPYDFAKSLGKAYPGVAPDATPGEWFVRANAVNAAECVRLPFRMGYDLRVNVSSGVALMSLEIPRPACFAIFTKGAANQAAAARAYALRLSYLIARLVFESCRAIKRVVILCHEHGHAQTLLSVNYTYSLLRRMRVAVEDHKIDGSAYPVDPAIRASFSKSTGWFEPVEPAVQLDAELVSPRDRFIYPELSDAQLSQQLAETTGGRVIADLSINENAARIEAADRLEERWDALEVRSCEAVVRTLTDVRDSANDHTVLEACARTITALNEGKLDPADTQGIRSLFVSGGTLEQAVDRARAYLEDEEHTDPAAAVSVLTEVLDPIRSLGEYLDDEFTVYRYFGSVSERVVFNLKVDDHRREVRLVPDAYFDALSNLASAYIALGENKQAIEVSDELMRIAPVSIYGALRKVRALENESRIVEAAELIKQMLAYAATPRDAALAQYRLAYMEWKLGREDLGVACYQRSLAWSTPMSDQAREELDDLLESYSHLRRLTDFEVISVLRTEGIPLGFDDDDVDRTMKAAVMLVDEGFFWTARPLLSVICSIEGDDVMMGIHRSLFEPGAVPSA